MTATMNNYNRELTLDELSGIYAGTAEAQDNAIVESVMIAALTFAAKLIIQTVMPDTFDEFYSIIKAHPALVQTGIAAVTGPPGVIAYNFLSSGTQKRLWEKVYNALK